jgi:predicted permease
MQAVLQDVRFAVKQLRKNLGFSIVVVLTLALSIGANTAIFSVVDALLLRPLPYPQPERLASLQVRVTNRPISGEPNSIDGETWRQLRESVPAMTAAVSSITSGVNLQAGGRAQYVKGQRVSASYFDVLGLHPMLGRGFTEAEDTAGGPLSVVLSNGLWSSTFASNPNIIGQAIELKGVSYTVIGVLAPGAQTPVKVDLWTSLRPTTSGEGGGDNYDPILRLKDGATWQQANAQLQQVQSMTTRYVAKRSGSKAFYQALPLQQGLASADRTPVLILMAAVGFVLLVACANLAGLALVRIGRRQSEIATRLALGATRWAILRQFWIESILLTAIGVSAALVLGKFTLQLINQRIPAEFLPVGGVAMDARVLLFAAAAGIAASLFFGLLPALNARRIDVRSAMTSSSRAVAQSGGTRTRYALIIGEVALTVVLLTVAGLLIRTLVYLRTLPPGFNPRNVVIAKASLDDARYNTQAAFLKLLDQSLAALRAIPGVESAGVGLTVPYERTLNYQVTVADGERAGEDEMTNLVYVTPGYFETLQIALRAGRLFTASDTPVSHDVAVVNKTFARRYLGSENAVGRHLKNDNIAMEVVGVVDDVVAPPG